jgi:WD40 repeat protein
MNISGRTSQALPDLFECCQARQRLCRHWSLQSLDPAISPFFQQLNIRTKTMKTCHRLIAGLRVALSLVRQRHTFPLLPLALVLLLVQPCAAQSGTWTFTGSLITGRGFHTATLLPNGKALVAGGDPYLASAELYDPASGTWSATGSLIHGRSLHTATLLANGHVLVAAGYSTLTAELYDPASGTWSATGSLGTEYDRYGHTATLLLNGKVLVVGGYDGSDIFYASTELYDPATGTWNFSGSLNTARWRHTATLLPNGKVLAVGGSNFVNYLTSAELYDPASGVWSVTGSLTVERESHTATLLSNGKVLVAGGYGSGPTAELYDPASGTWSATGSLATDRFAHTATLLPNGKVLIAGGTDLNFDQIVITELYDPASNTWTTSGSLNTAREAHTATLLPDGKVLAAGGAGDLASAELYTSDAGSIALVSAASRKTHGAKGDFEIGLPLTGNVGIECRSGLTRYAVVLTFNNNVTGADSATSSCGKIGSISVDPSDSHKLIVTYNGATCNGQNVTVTANNVHDDQGTTLASVAVSMGLLVGDVTGDGRVANDDTAAVRAALGQQANSSNFRNDVTLDGRINNQDVQTVRSHKGDVLP